MRVKPIDILFRVDGLDHTVLADMLRQRELHQNAVDSHIGIEFMDFINQLLLGDFSRQ